MLLAFEIRLFDEVKVDANVIQVQEFDYHGERLTNILYVNAKNTTGFQAAQSVTFCGSQAERISESKSQNLVFHISRVKHRTNCNDLVAVDAASH